MEGLNPSIGSVRTGRTEEALWPLPPVPPSRLTFVESSHTVAVGSGVVGCIAPPDEGKTPPIRDVI